MRRMSQKSHHFGRLNMHFIPLLVWLAAVIAVVGLFSHRARRFEVLGVAQSRIYQVAATSPGRLKDIPVSLFNEVKQGQTVALVDTVLDNEKRPEGMKAQLATIQAEIGHLTAQLVSTRDNFLADKSDRETNQLTNARRFAIDMENARLDILRLRALIETDRAMLEDLALEVKVAQYLVKKDAAAPYELQKANLQYNALAKKLEENEHLIEQAKNDLQESLRRRDEYAQHQPYYPSVDSALNVIRKAIKVQEQRMDELTVKYAALQLKAPFDGAVSQVLRQPGEAVLAGEPILTVTEVKPSEIIAYVSESQANLIQEGMKVELIKDSEVAQIVTSYVKYVGPTIEQMPMRWWRNPNIPQWGRPFLVEAPTQMKLIMGERVGIRRL